MFENWTIFSCGQFGDHVDLSMGFSELPVSGLLSLQSFWPIQEYCLYCKFKCECLNYAGFWIYHETKSFSPSFPAPAEPKKMALTESLCTQNIQASDHALLAQASGTVQIMAYPTSPMACLTPPHLHLSITVWTIWPLPTTTGTPIDTPATGTSGTETDLWVRRNDLLASYGIGCMSLP